MFFGKEMEDQGDQGDDEPGLDFLLGGLKRTYKLFKTQQDVNILSSCLAAVAFAKNDNVLNEDYASKLMLWVSKWPSGDAGPMPTLSNDGETIVEFKQKGEIDPGRFIFRGEEHDITELNVVVPWELRQDIFNQLGQGLKSGKDKQISLQRNELVSIFLGDMLSVISNVDLSIGKKKKEK